MGDVSIPLRFDLNFGLKVRAFPGTCFHPATVRFEWNTVGNLLGGRVSIPLRFDLNSTLRTRPADSHGFHPATVRFEFSSPITTLRARKFPSRYGSI